jgi:hypothetical protein
MIPNQLHQPHQNNMKHISLMLLLPITLLGCEIKLQLPPPSTVLDNITLPSPNEILNRTSPTIDIPSSIECIEHCQLPTQLPSHFKYNGTPVPEQ